jgi:hypothetical protein
MQKKSNYGGGLYHIFKQWKAEHALYISVFSMVLPHGKMENV